MQRDKEKLMDLYRKMLLVRRLEKRVEELVFGARVPCSGHFGLGQEAVGVGVTGALRTTDYLFGTHRGFAEYIGKGMSPREILTEYYGKKTSISEGRLGQHLLKTEIGIMPLPSSLGSEFGMSVGCALSSLRRGSDAVTLNLFGEGTASQSDFYAALEMACIWKVPLVFACNNNQFVELDRFSNLTPVTDVALRAEAFGMPNRIVDGNDIVAVWEATDEAVRRAREGQGPSLLEFKTYRRSTHYTGDPGGYQPPEEIAQWEARDPIDRCRTLLREMGVLNEADEREMEASVDAEVENAVDFAETSPFPDPRSIEVEPFT